MRLPLAFDKISAVIPTRGDVDMQPVLDTLPFGDVVVWDNSKEDEDLKVFGRFAAIDRAQHEVIYTQDDDCTIPPEAFVRLVEHYKADEIVCNMPISRWADYPDSCLIGWGSIFHRDMPARAFDPYFAAYPEEEHDDLFFKCCDVVFTTLVPHVKLDLGFTHLPWAETKGRMFKQPDHSQTRWKVLEMARAVRDAT